MHRRFGGIAVVCASLAIPATAAAATKTVYSGGPVKFQGTLQKKYGAGADGFTVQKVTVNVGDTVVWDGKSRFGGFHTIEVQGHHERPKPRTIRQFGGARQVIGEPLPQRWTRTSARTFQK